MRMLFAATTGLGHLLPLLPLARAARSAGHEAVIGTGSSLADRVERAGFRHAPLRGDIIAAREQLPPVDHLPHRERRETVRRLMFGGPIARTMATDALAFAGSWSPDVIVHEDADLGSPLAAEKLGIPAVTVQASAWRSELTAAAALGIADLRRELALPPDPDGRLQHRSLYLATRPASIRAVHEPYPRTSRELRPIADDADGPEPDAEAEDPPAMPRIGVTFGTVAWDRVDIRSILDALADLPVEVVVALGSDPARLGAVPANARVSAYIPMSRLLPTCSVLIFHGGSGTMLAALAVGVPLVVVPLGADQYDNAEACQAAGVATVLDGDALTAEAVIAAVEEAATPGRGARSAEIAAEIAAMPEPEVAVTAIEALVGS